MGRARIIARHVGGHGHGGARKAVSPYGKSDGAADEFGRECSIPARAASVTFLLAFLIAISGVSIPTSITGAPISLRVKQCKFLNVQRKGFVLPTTVQTALLWACTLGSVTYGGFGLALSFSILDESTGLEYKRPGRARPLQEQAAVRRKFHTLNLVMLAIAVAVVTCQGVLWKLLRGSSMDTWMAICLNSALAITEEVCERQYLNQRYVLAMFAGLLVLAEAARFYLATQFIREADKQVDERLARMTQQEVFQAQEEMRTRREASTQDSTPTSKEQSQRKRKHRSYARLRSGGSEEWSI